MCTYCCSPRTKEDSLFQKIKPEPKLFPALKLDRFVRLDWEGLLNHLVQTEMNRAESKKGRVICWLAVESWVLAGGGANGR